MSQTPPADDEFLLVGELIGPFGVRGQVKMRSYTDHIEHLRRRITTVYLGPTHQPCRLSAVLVHKSRLLVLSLADVSTREAAEALRGTEVMIREQEAAPLEQDEYFLHQLYGATVVTEHAESLGTVREVLTTGANDVLIVTRSGRADLLIPMIHEVVLDLDLSHGRIVVRLLPGLLPEEA